MARPVITAEQLHLAQQGVACGDSVAEIADRLGVAYNTLWRRLCRAGLLPAGEDPRGDRLVFVARCTECCVVIRATERGEGGVGFLRWVAQARRHARSRHGLSTERAEVWADRLWCRSGRRMSIHGPGAASPVQAGS